MDEVVFWDIVEKINWPKMHYDKAKYWFIENYTLGEAEAFRSLFDEKRNALVKASGEDMCCDSWDDTLAHIIGLGKEEYDRHIENPELILKREREVSYVESFAYCIPFSDDYGKLTDDGYEEFIYGTKRLIDELQSAYEDDIPPKLYRQFPKIIIVAQYLIEKRWQEAVEKYHEYFGPGYADKWPLNSYGIPNFVTDLERYRLRRENI